MEEPKEDIIKYHTKTRYSEAIYDQMTRKFWDEVYDVPYTEQHKFRNSQTEKKWITKLFMKSIDPKHGAELIERAYEIFVRGS